jgi:hypothetical protein
VTQKNQLDCHDKLDMWDLKNLKLVHFFTEEVLNNLVVNKLFKLSDALIDEDVFIKVASLNATLNQ